MTFPDFFEPALTKRYSADDVKRILDGLATPRKTTLRANTLVSSRDEIADALDDAGIFFNPVGWYGDAFVINDARERAIWDMAAYQEGKLYLQSLSSMIPPLVLDARAGEDVLDMCAAPGGKTSQIAALTGGGAHLTACEMHAPRADKLEHNLAKLGARNVVVMRTDARRLDDFFRFDRILVDAPCSGSGTIRPDDPKLAKRFTPTLVEKSRKSQRALLSKALGLLKPGGTLVYSTCSIFPEENEDIVTECLAKAGKRASFELKPVVLGDDAPGDASDGEGASGDINALPTLPRALDEALLVCPTELYEGFFTVKIERTA